MDLPTTIGRYAVERLIGEGGMGRVLLARDSVLGRKVALKILRDDLALPPGLRIQLLARMRQEARAAAALSHPGMVTLHDMGEDEAVGLYLVFELIEGPTLRDRLQRSGPLPPAEVAVLARTLGSALTHAHDAGVVHRDVKPENVMLARTGPKLTDFGIARLQDSTLTRATTVLGTPAYSAPEALASGAFGAASDEFSLAATLYEALTGKRAFPGDDALAVATRVATAKHASVTAQVPSLRRFVHLDAIFDRALAKEARTRFATCEMFGNLVASELEGANEEIVTPAPSSIVPRATRRWQNMAALASVVVIGSLIAIGRFHQDDDGVSFKSVASAFGATVGSAPRMVVSSPPGPSHHPAPSATTSATTGALAVPQPATDAAAPAWSATASSSSTPAPSAPSSSSASAAP